MSCDILKQGQKQVPYARQEDYSSLMLFIENKMLEFMGCTNGRLISFTASGTGAMESVVSNIVGENDKVLVIHGGGFGKRWIEILNFYGAQKILQFEVGFGKQPDYELLNKILSKDKPSIVFCQHHETSSGELFNINLIGSMCKKVGSIFVVDAISSFLADEVNMTKDHIDIMITSSHKGLCIPPGLSFVALNERALNINFINRGLYFNFEKNLASLNRGQPLFSPASQIFFQLAIRLRIISDLGVQSVIANVREKALSFRNIVADEGYSFVPQVASNSLTSFFIKNNTKHLVNELKIKGFYVMESSMPRQIRVAHANETSIETHKKLAETIITLEKKAI